MGRLQARLETLSTIEQAKGVIMAQSRVGSEEAFDILRRASQRTNMKLRDLAADIVTRAEQPAGPSPPISPAIRRPGESA
jgi:AmiR/NasT family two-component response regulator